MRSQIHSKVRLWGGGGIAFRQSQKPNNHQNTQYLCTLTIFLLWSELVNTFENHNIYVALNMFFNSQIFFETKIIQPNVENPLNMSKRKCCTRFHSSPSLSFASSYSRSSWSSTLPMIGRCLLFALLWKFLSGNFRQSHSGLIKNIIIIIEKIKKIEKIPILEQYKTFK